MSEHKKSIKKAQRRAFRVRYRIKIDSGLPRVTVFRSLKQIYAQVIDDRVGKTLLASSSFQVDRSSCNKKAIARKVGLDLAKKALALNIPAVVFDRGSYLYHGRIRELAEGLREGGVSL